MKSFPMFIKTSGRRVVIVGGGEQAAQKTRLILKTDAQIDIVAPHLDDELQDLADAGRITQVLHVSAKVFDNAAMGFIATGCPGLDVAMHALAKAARCPVNVVDRPELCDLTTPALVDRDPIVVAIGSEGTAPVLTREIKTRLETMLPQNLGGLAALAGRLRGGVARHIAQGSRRPFWAWVFKSDPRKLWEQGKERDASRLIKDTIVAGVVPDKANGRVSLVGAGPGARDLMTLRAVQRLQEADVIFYDRLVDEEVLELARRDAERVFVGKHVGAHSWPQEQINRVIVAEALKGRAVVRLKSGDPGIFGRAGEELDALNAAGVSVDIVPGITAASAAAAAMGRPLTERGVSDTLVLTTGRARDGVRVPDASRMLAPGTTAVFYMSVGQAGRISRDLLKHGVPHNAPVKVAMDVSKPNEKLDTCGLENLEAKLIEMECTGCAVITVTWPEDTAHTNLSQLRQGVA